MLWTAADLRARIATYRDDQRATIRTWDAAAHLEADALTQAEDARQVQADCALRIAEDAAEIDRLLDALARLPAQHPAL